MAGFIKLYRSFFFHHLWEEPREFSRAEAFLDLLQLAAHAHRKQVIKGVLVTLAPGQLCGSQRFLADRWGWSTKKVRTYLALLEADSIIEPQKNREGTIITLCNYSRHNGDEPAEEPQKTQRRTAKEPPRNQIKEGREGKEEESPLTPQGGNGQQEEIRVLPSNWKKLNATERKRVQCRANNKLMITVGRFVGRKPETLWTVAEALALKDLTVSSDDVKLMASYYGAAIDKDRDYRRRDLLTLLNNWSGELDRARLFSSSQ